MSDRLSWVFELIDKVSGPAHKSAEGLEAIEHSAHGAEGALGKFHDALEIAYEGGEMLAEAWEKLKEFGGEIIGEMKFKQDSLIALEALTKSREEARSLFEETEEFAYKTGGDVKALMGLTKDLAASGFGGEEIDTFRLLLGDLRIIDPNKAEAIGSAIGEIGRRGFLASRQMMMLSNAGIDQSMMYQELAKRLGTTEGALRGMSNLRVAKGTALDVIASIMLQKYSGGQAGSLVEKQMNTIPTLLARVRSIPEKLFDELTGLDFGAGGGPFARMLENIANAFDPESESGQRIISGLRSLVDYVAGLFGIDGGPNGLFAELSGPNGVKKVEEIFLGLIDWTKNTAIPALQAFGHAMSIIAGAIERTANAYDTLVNHRNALPATIGDMSKADREAMARATLSDPNTSELTKETARRVLGLPSQAPTSPVGWEAPVVVHINGNATKEDAEHIGRVTAEHVSNAFEQYGFQLGSYYSPAGG